MSNAKFIGERISRARKQAGLSQANLALRLHISPQAVGKWERGESLPDLLTLAALAELLGVDLNHFSERFSAGEHAPVTSAIRDVLLVAPAMPKRNMSEGNWANADFSGLSGLTDTFSAANIQNCLFLGSDLSGLLMRGNNTAGCDFTGSVIIGSKFQRSNLSKNLFTSCNLSRTEFSDSNIGLCNFTDADFTEAVFRSCNFQSNILNGGKWLRTVFTGLSLDDALFEGTLENCHFENCSFNRVTFQNATLINTFFKNNKRMKKAVFKDCKADRMTYAFLQNEKADMTGISIIAQAGAVG